MQPYDKNNQETSKDKSGDIFYYCFPGLLQFTSLSHRIFTRNCGYSAHPYKSLNISYAVDDNPAFVDQNITLVRQNIGAEQLIHMNQQHGKEVISLKNGKAQVTDKVFDADALITDIPSVAIMVKQADCQGIILFDPVRQVAAVVHSGWKGSVKNILGETVKKMESDFSCSPSDIHAAIGPSLGPCCAEFKAYEEIFPKHFQKHMVSEFNFDFRAISETQLSHAGLTIDNIETADICTKCRTDIFFSYRGEGLTGRFATVAMIKNRPGH